MTQLATRPSSTTDTGRTLRFGWFIPTYGDSATLGPGSRDDRIPPSMDLFLSVAEAAEGAGFEYALVPVAVGCYEA